MPPRSSSPSCLIYPFSLARSRRGWLVDWRIATIPVAALGLIFGQYFLARPQLDLSTAGPALLAPLAVLLAFLGYLVLRPARDRLTPMDVLLALAAVATLAWPIVPSNSSSSARRAPRAPTSSLGP